MGQYQESSRLRNRGPQLAWQVSYRLGYPLIYVRGELDHRGVGLLRRAIDEELRPEKPILMLDFTELGYMDSAGLSLLFDTVRRFKEPGWLGVIGANQSVSRLMEITGLLDAPCFRLFRDQGSASAAISH